MSRWPDDPTSYRPSARWLGIVVVAIMLGIFALIGTWMWMSAHHSSLVSRASGDRTGSGVTLTVSPETRTYEYSATDMRTRETGDLVAQGTIDGQSVSGRIAVPRFPPWGGTLSTSLGGRAWTLRAQDGGRSLVLAGDGGRSVTLSRAQ
jgi:hypothetical protein